MGVNFEDSALNKIWRKWDVIEDEEDCEDDLCNKEIFLENSQDIDCKEHKKQIASLLKKKIIDVHVSGSGAASILKTSDSKTVLRYDWDNGTIDIFLEDED